MTVTLFLFTQDLWVDTYLRGVQLCLQLFILGLLCFPGASPSGQLFGLSDSSYETTTLCFKCQSHDFN